MHLSLNIALLEPASSSLLGSIFVSIFSNFSCDFFEPVIVLVNLY